ncbi:hypothetical protein Desdi_2754 [Desulfitobacterium dichloroeliminans LMG P-21439]|uniref:CzcB-like barrel-sandwich hybrid domain-containing protein n=1 Tax=Desulfitobacterium dichloroeliminans (strain LMG P-21439 / DCA1) TaxID=871963 RepID=L0FB50_DESDL|nr:HlyD family efflux transporter periplasmic adaptor subunit [Desulfitobacterium dichloroeliminans]AGA70168.1 hypothetical protein Desdi_2754 [Desulfitobacterium dichloroeliminans LMG P-21439]
MRRILWAVGLSCLILAMSGCSSSDLVFEGIVETTIYSHYSEVAGKITQLSPELGQGVKAGDLIAVIDDRKEKDALKQLEATLAKKKTTLAELTASVDSEEIQQSRNNVALAEIALANAQLSRDRVQKDYENVQALWKGGALPQADLDKVKYQADLAETAVSTATLQADNARQKLALVEKGAPQEKIDSAQADIALTEIQIRQTQENLAKYKLTALQDGTIISKNYLLGNMVSPGYNIADIASETEKHLVVYIPEEHLSKISYGQEMLIRNRTEEYKGTVIFIDVVAQYSPKDLQTSANKNKESMKIKVSLAEDIPLKIGEKAELILAK